MKASDEIATMVHAFAGELRKKAVRRLAERVRHLEAVATAAKAWDEKFHSDMPEAAAVRKALAELAALEAKDGAQ